MKKKSFGILKSTGREASLITVEGKNGMSFAVTDYGAALVSLCVPDRNGERLDICLGYDSVEGYEKNAGCLGAIIGRIAGRISGAKFTFQGKEYLLEDNDGGNTLHSGRDGFDRRLWAYQMLEGQNAVAFYLTSPDGDQGMPGEVHICVTYRLTEDGGLQITYAAVPEQDTLINMTNHTYFNLDGHAAGNCLEHTVQINADFMNRLRQDACPNGEIISVRGTPYDFTEPHTIGERGCGGEGGKPAVYGDYNESYVLNGYDGSVRKVAAAHSDKTGITMETYTDQPGLIFYTARYVDGYTGGKDGVVYREFAGFCMETQHFPDTPNQPHFPSILCKKGQAYHSETTYQFQIE